MGISINLYRVSNAGKLADIKDLESQIAKAADTKVDLYKIHEDLAVIFQNSTDPFDPDTIPYKMLYGWQAYENVSVGLIGGFLPAAEVPVITKWIKDNKIETYEGFSQMCDNLSDEVLELLEEMGTDDTEPLFTGYVKPLVDLYFTALENKNSVLFIGE